MKQVQQITSCSIPKQTEIRPSSASTWFTGDGRSQKQIGSWYPLRKANCLVEKQKLHA